jgi:hypothetical protein
MTVEVWRLSEFMDRLFNLGGLLVPIVALVVGGVIGITSMILRHNERIAKIERGINPDGPWPNQQR